MADPAKTCPVHYLGGQSFSVEEMKWLLAHRIDIQICYNCAHWLRKQLQNKGEIYVEQYPEDVTK